MSKSPSLSRAEYLYKIQRHLESVARLAETQPEVFDKLVNDRELKQIEEIVSQLVTGLESEIN
ncbi:MAG: hypothetical protein QNI91_18675 [Arenicellales bacterium]|nr:hypothetical protein [Arenicellales bacterium]